MLLTSEMRIDKINRWDIFTHVCGFPKSDVCNRNYAT